MLSQSFSKTIVISTMMTKFSLVLSSGIKKSGLVRLETKPHGRRLGHVPYYRPKRLQDTITNNPYKASASSEKGTSRGSARDFQLGYPLSDRVHRGRRAKDSDESAQQKPKKWLPAIVMQEVARSLTPIKESTVRLARASVSSEVSYLEEANKVTQPAYDSSTPSQRSKTSAQHLWDSSSSMTDTIERSTSRTISSTEKSYPSVIESTFSETREKESIELDALARETSHGSIPDCKEGTLSNHSGSGSVRRTEIQEPQNKEGLYSEVLQLEPKIDLAAQTEESNSDTISTKGAMTIPLVCLFGVGGGGAIVSTIVSFATEGGIGEGGVTALVSFGMFALPFILLILGMQCYKGEDARINKEKLVIVGAGSIVLSCFAVGGWSVARLVDTPLGGDGMHYADVIVPTVAMFFAAVAIVLYLWKKTCYGRK